MGFIKDISTGLNVVSNSIDAPDYYKWMILPFIITFIITIIFIGLPIYTKFTTLTVCEKDEVEEEEKNNCSIVKVHVFYRILTIFIIALFLSGIISGISYKTVLYIKNPKLAMGIETTRIVKNVFNG